eukprot:Tbor_TRINITY_DN3897_c0_g1::TRINITY_DN3897_c0_g1_i1::g.5573::m.5573/K06180/rluD; 23S rRNA pseudouridine1911/1915/1917 synthase
MRHLSCALAPISTKFQPCASPYLGSIWWAAGSFPTAAVFAARDDIRKELSIVRSFSIAHLMKIERSLDRYSLLSKRVAITSLLGEILWNRRNGKSEEDIIIAHAMMLLQLVPRGTSAGEAIGDACFALFAHSLKTSVGNPFISSDDIHQASSLLDGIQTNMPRKFNSFEKSNLAAEIFSYMAIQYPNALDISHFRDMFRNIGNDVVSSSFVNIFLHPGAFLAAHRILEDDQMNETVKMGHRENYGEYSILRTESAKDIIIRNMVIRNLLPCQSVFVMMDAAMLFTVIAEYNKSESMQEYIQKLLKHLFSFPGSVQKLLGARMFGPVCDTIEKQQYTKDKQEEQSQFVAFIEECGTDYIGDKRQSFQLRMPTSLGFSKSDTPTHMIQAYLHSLAPHSSYWTQLVKLGYVTGDVDTGVISVSHPEQADCVFAKCAMSIPISIVYEDDSILAINKPSGMPVVQHLLAHKCKDGACKGDVLSWLLINRPEQRNIFNGGLVHRLDKGTSGVMVIAKTPESSARLRHSLGKSFSIENTNSSSKQYAALVLLKTKDLSTFPLKGVIEENLGKGRYDTNMFSAKDDKSITISTQFSVVNFLPKVRIGLIRARITQGKKHQVRRHLASIGAPLIGDVKYGGKACSTSLFPSAALHAQSLVITHPSTGRLMQLSAPLPGSWNKLLNGLKDLV